MPRDYMGALADEGAYDPETDRLLPPPRSPAAIPLPVEQAIGRGLKAADYYVGLPSRVMGGVANPYPEGSDLAQARENIDLDARQRWGASTGLGMVFDPAAAWATKPGVPGLSLGSGAGSRIKQPTMGEIADQAAKTPLGQQPAFDPFTQARVAAAGKRGEQILREAEFKLGPEPTAEQIRQHMMRPQPMGSVFEQSSHVLASPEAINRAAAESQKGITQPELRQLYNELGLTGREPSELVKPSLAAQQPETARQAAVSLKLADRAMLDTLTKEQRLAYQIGGKLPRGVQMPSQEAVQPALKAFEPIKKEVGRAEAAFDANVLRGIKPSLFDLSPQILRATPQDVAQFALPRVAPEMTERLASVPRGGMARLERAAAAAPPENWGWYNLMQARDLFRSIHGPQKGEQAFEAWLSGTAGTSMVNPIDNNIRSSTWYLQQILQGKPLPEVMHIADPVTGKIVKAMAGGPPPGYGAKSQVQHADRVQEYLRHTYDPVSNPKPISYYMNLSGNWVPRTVDTHDIRNMVGMPRALDKFGAEESSLLPKEYSYLEGVGQRAAERAGAAQAPQQAATWVGGGEYTGLKSYPAPLMEVLNRRAHVTAAVRGITPDQAMREAFSGVRPLLGLGGAAVMAPAFMGGTVKQDEYQ